MKGWKGFVDSVASKFAFFPPQPSTYKVHEHIDGHRELYIQPLIRHVIDKASSSCWMLHARFTRDLKFA